MFFGFILLLCSYSSASPAATQEGGGVAAAEDEINVARDLTVGVVLGGRFAGRKTAE